MNTFATWLKSIGATTSSWLSIWRNASTHNKLYWILWIAVIIEYYGHGAFGVFLGGSAPWLAYFNAVGIAPALAWKVMPLVGIADFIVATIILFYPCRIILLYAALWGFWTALLRPIAGQGIWQWGLEIVNFAVPFALLYLSGWGTSVRAWITERTRPILTPNKAIQLSWFLRIIIAALLIGHGGSGLFDHATIWINYFGVLGINSATISALSLINIVGFFEIILGIVVLFRPHPYLLVFVFTWKVFTEFLRVPAGEVAFGFIERAATYAAPLALLYVVMWIQQARSHTETFPMA